MAFKPRSRAPCAASTAPTVRSKLSGYVCTWKSIIPAVIWSWGRAGAGVCASATDADPATPAAENCRKRRREIGSRHIVGPPSGRRKSKRHAAHEQGRLRSAGDARLYIRKGVLARESVLQRANRAHSNADGRV